MGFENLPDHDDRPEAVALFTNRKAAPTLEALLAEYSAEELERPAAVLPGG